MSHLEVAPEFERTRSNQAWARWLARGLDVVLLMPATFLLFMGLGVAAELGYLPREIMTWAQDPILVRVMELAAAFLLFCLWEPLFLANAGTTPGKWLMGIRVRGADGGKLSYPRALWRFVQVWVVGLAAGIPLLVLATMLMARARLQSDGSTSWDESVGAQVTHSKRHPALWALLIVSVFAVNITVAVLARMDAAPR